LLDKFPPEHVWSRGINLNISCSEHQVKSLASYLIFGVYKKAKN